MQEEANPADAELLSAITSERPKSEIVKLIQSGAKVNSTDSRGETPLHLIALMSPVVKQEMLKDYLDVVIHDGGSLLTMQGQVVDLERCKRQSERFPRMDSITLCMLLWKSQHHPARLEIRSPSLSIVH